MRERFLLIFLFTGFWFCGFSQQTFSKVVEKLLNQPEYRNATIGISIKDLKSGETVYDLNSDKLMIPASTLKLVTTASALEILGVDYRFETKLGYIGETEKNLLKGDLVLIGGGDPVLGSEYFQNHYFQNHFFEVWARKIKNAGITKINGNFVLDGSVYDSDGVPETWIWEDIGNYYGAGTNAFTVYDNMFRITFRSPNRSGKLTKIISIYPKIEDLEITNKVLSSNTNSDEAYVFGSPLDNTREIRGSIPKNRNAFTIKAAIHKPEKVLASEFLKYLAKEGVFISGKIKFEKVNKKEFQTLYIQESPTLAEIVKVINFKSVNLFAEHLVLQIAAEKTGQGNRLKGIEIIKDFWKAQNIQTENIFIEDGSGLSHFNAISPVFFTELLLRMKNNNIFLNTLPGAGEGTLSGFKKENFKKNSLKAKSGSMTRLKSYAGYLDTNSGEKLAFSIMINHYSGSNSKLTSEIENLLLQLQSFM